MTTYQILRTDRTDDTDQEVQVAHSLPTRAMAEHVKAVLQTGSAIHMLPSGLPRYAYVIRKEGVQA